MNRFAKVFLLLIISVSSLAQTKEDSVVIANTHWAVEKPMKGIKTMHAEFDNLYGGLQDIYIVEVSLKHHPLAVLDHNGRALTSEKAMAVHASAAINGTYFDMGETARPVCFIAHGDKVVEYTHGSMGQLSNGAVVMGGKKVEIIPWDVDIERMLYPDSIAVASTDGKDVMVCGPLLVQNGKEEKFFEESHVMQKHPRSGIAVRGKKAYFIIVDGRDAERAIGVTIPEFAHFMRIMKMDSALNLDGGGSSVLWVHPKVDTYNDGTPVCPCTGILNTPSDAHGKERMVSYSIIAK